MPTRSVSPPPAGWGPSATGLIEAAASARPFSPRPPSPGAPPVAAGPPAVRTIPPVQPNPMIASPSWQPPVVSTSQQPSFVPTQVVPGMSVVTQAGTAVLQPGATVVNAGPSLTNTTILVTPGTQTMQPPLPTGFRAVATPKASGVPLQAEQDISSIHALSPLSRSELQIPELADADQKHILDHCRDTTKMVNQLAAVLKGLEADVDNLRKENQNLRQTVAQGLHHEIAAPKAATTTLTEPVSAETVLLSSEGAPPSAIPSFVPIGAPGPARNVSSQPGKAIGSASEPAVQQTPNRSTAPLMQGSPRFGQTPQPFPSPMKSGSSSWPFPSTAPAPLTPSPGHHALNADSPMGALASPPHTAESAATIVGPMSAHEASPEIVMQHPGIVHERREMQSRVAGLHQYTTAPDVRRKAAPTVYEVQQPGQAMDGLLWHMEQTIWLGAEADEKRFKGMAQVLASDTIVSVSAAVEGLNRGTLKCSDDFCIAYSMSNNSYYLLYRRGLEEKAHALQRAILHGSANAAVVAPPPPVTVHDEQTATRPTTPDTHLVPARQQALSSMSAQSMISQVSTATPTLTHHPQRIRAVSSGQHPQAQYSPPVASQDFTAVPSLRSDVAYTTTKNPVDAELSFNEIPSVSMSKAEELLTEQLRRGIQPSEEAFDSVITAVGGDSGAEGLAKAEEYFWKAIEMGTVPGEASFNTVLLLACREGDVEKAEAVMVQMLHCRLRGSPEIFDIIIRMFSERRDALKVEEWLLNAGQSGWTPGQEAFESVVQLFAQIDAAKAEEWLSRAQQTEYRLPDICFDVVIRAFLRVSNASKANEWLSRMLNDGRVPSESTLQEAVKLLIESGDVPHAEAWLAQLARTYNTPIDTYCLSLFSAAMHAGDLDCAERQLEALSDTDPGRTQLIVMAHAARGDHPRAKSVLERYRKLGGVPTAEINLAMLSTCAAAQDREGVHALARCLAHTGNLTMSEFPVLQQAMGDDEASALMKELGLTAVSASDSMQSEPVAPQETRRKGGSSAGTRSPSAKASTKGPVRRGGGRGSRAMR